MRPWLVRQAALAAPLLLVAGAAPAIDRGADGKFDKRTSAHFDLYQDVDIDRTGGLHGSRHFEQTVLADLERAFDRLDDQLGDGREVAKLQEFGRHPEIPVVLVDLLQQHVDSVAGP